MVKPERWDVSLFTVTIRTAVTFTSFAGYGVHSISCD